MVKRIFRYAKRQGISVTKALAQIIRVGMTHIEYEEALDEGINFRNRSLPV